MTLGQRIQQIRTSHALSQEAFGAKLGTTRQTVSKWELDQTIPEIQKIVLMSKLFSVTTDSILVDGISTFDTEYEQFVCGVYRSPNCEIVETERFSLLYYYSKEQHILSTKLYMGLKNDKKLFAICEYHQDSKTIDYAYSTQIQTIHSNNSALEILLGERYDCSHTKSMKRLEKFFVNHGTLSLPTVSEAGIKACLQQWRMADSFQATPDMFYFSLYTGKTEYIFSIFPEDTNIYCGASYNIPFDMGLFDAGQFFRIRSYKDNSAPWCGFYCDFSFEKKQVNIPIAEYKLGNCVNTPQGLMWCIKRYTEHEIVLQGCGDDEYIYHRDEHRTESFVREL